MPFIDAETLPSPEPAEAPAPVDDLPLAPDGSYRTTAEVARGGMGRVLSAWDLRLGRRVAVKELLKPSPSLAGRFVREALMTARLQHPSIIPVYDAGRRANGDPFYVMKLVAGRSLSELLRERPHLQERLTLLPMLIAVGEALSYAHSKGVVHRDLKPSNVMVGDFGETLVIDWGLAKWLGSDEAALSVELPPARGETGVGGIVGTPGYMAPEQAEGKPATLQSDVWSLGAILFTLLAGEPPRTPRQPLHEGAPRELCAIVERALAAHPLDRYPSAKELTADLERFVAGQMVAAHRYSWMARLRRWVARHRLAVSVAAAALLSALATAGLTARRILDERDRADAERDKARAAQAREAARVDELILAEARGLVGTDPTRALAWLSRLRPELRGGPDARIITAEAQARGVAEEVLPSGGLAGLAWVAGKAVPIGVQSADAGSADGRVRVAAGERVYRVDGAARPLPFAPTAVAVSRDGRRLALATASELWSLEVSGGARRRWTVRGQVKSLTFSPDGEKLAAMYQDGAVDLWQIAAPDQPPVEVIRRGTGRAGALAFSPDGALLAASRAATVRLWDWSGDRKLHGHAGEVTALAFSPDGTRLASAGVDGTIRVWRPGRLPADTRATAPRLPPGQHAAAGPWRAEVVEGGALQLFLQGASAPARLASRPAKIVGLLLAADGTLDADYDDGVRRRFLPPPAPEALTRATIDGFAARADE